MNGTFKQQSQDALEAANAERAKMRIRDAEGLVYGVGLHAQDPWTGEQVKIVDMCKACRENPRTILVSLESGTNLLIEAVAWRVLNIEVEELT